MLNVNGGFYKGLVLLILAQVMVGINIVAAKQLLHSITMIDMLVIRFFIAMIILFLLHQCTSSAHQSMFVYVSQLQRRDWFFLILQAVSAGVLFNCLMLWGLNHTDANIAGIITSALPAIIAVLSWLMLGEKLTSKSILCIFLACVGLLVIALSKFRHLGLGHSFFGDCIVFISLFPEAAYYVFTKIHRVQLPVFLLSALINAVNTILMLSVALFMPAHTMSLDFKGFMILFVLGLNSGLFFVFWNYGCQTVESILASLTTAAMPIATVIIAWIVLGEGLTVWQGIGMGLVILSIIVYAKQ